MSALLAPLQFADQAPLPRAALMKVFVSKPGAAPVLHFDCRTFWVGEDGGDADYAINAVRYHPIPGDAGEDKYEGPEFRYCLFRFTFTVILWMLFYMERVNLNSKLGFCIENFVEKRVFLWRIQVEL